MSTMTDQDEREQFSAMIARMNAETRKFIAEHDKLAAEAQKLNRDRLFAPFLAPAAVGGAVAGVVATLGRLL